jgi:hypothetical protein
MARSKTQYAIINLLKPIKLTCLYSLYIYLLIINLLKPIKQHETQYICYRSMSLLRQCSQHQHSEHSNHSAYKVKIVHFSSTSPKKKNGLCITTLPGQHKLCKCNNFILISPPHPAHEQWKLREFRGHGLRMSMLTHTRRLFL